jgi:hypothetical protein
MLFTMALGSYQQQTIPRWLAEETQNSNQSPSGKGTAAGTCANAAGDSVSPARGRESDNGWRDLIGRSEIRNFDPPE